jgi:hypothetical protein
MMTNIGYNRYGDNFIEENSPTVNDYDTQQAHTVWNGWPMRDLKSLSQTVEPLLQLN